MVPKKISQSQSDDSFLLHIRFFSKPVINYLSKQKIKLFCSAHKFITDLYEET